MLVPPLQEKAELRQSSIVLFGNLTKFSAGSCEDAFFEQILNGLVALLLHLQDPKPEVVKVGGSRWAWRGAGAVEPGELTTRPFPPSQACKFALRMCGPSMGCPVLCDMFQNHLHEDRSLHYGEFMNDVCKHLVSERQPRGEGSGPRAVLPSGSRAIWGQELCVGGLAPFQHACCWPVVFCGHAPVHGGSCHWRPGSGEVWWRKPMPGDGAPILLCVCAP